MRIYLDCCCLQRPFDDQTQPRIKVETEAVLAILASVQAGDVSLLGSEALDYEASRIPNEERRGQMAAILALANEYVEMTPGVEQLAASLEKSGIFPMDALHLALASTAGADFFATCDGKLLRKGPLLAKLECPVISLLDLAAEVLP